MLSVEDRREKWNLIQSSKANHFNSQSISSKNGVFNVLIDPFCSKRQKVLQKEIVGKVDKGR